MCYKPDYRRCRDFEVNAMTMTPTVQTEGRITIDPAICNGKPVIRGLRITVETVLGYLSAGDSASDILEQYPQLEPEDIKACLEFAARLTGHNFAVTKPV